MLLATFDDWAMRFPECRCKQKADFQFSGIAHHIMDTGNKAAFNAIFCYLNNGILVCDDPITYTPKNLDSHPLKNILARRRQMKCDIVFIAHAFMRIPPMFFDYVTDYVIFNCEAPTGRKKELGQHYEALSKIVERVKKKAKTDPHYHEYYKTGL